MTRKQARIRRERRAKIGMFFAHAAIGICIIACGAAVIVWAALLGMAL